MVKKAKQRGRPPKSKIGMQPIPGKRRPWTIGEDESITRLVQQHGTKQWAVIAEMLNNEINFSSRSGKQCRERWHNHLDPLILKEPWTLEEEKILFEKHIELGNKWADISNFIEGRTDNSIKNHFYSSLRRQHRKISGFDGTRDQVKELDMVLSTAILNAINKKIKNRRQSKPRSESCSPTSDKSSYEDLRSLDDLVVTGYAIDLTEFNYFPAEELFFFPCDFS